MRRIIASMRRGEDSITTVKYSYIQDKDEEMRQILQLAEGIDLLIHITLYNFMRVEDVYNDGSTLRKELDIGIKSAYPLDESTVTCIYTFIYII